jgi:hypothetical protein
VSTGFGERAGTTAAALCNAARSGSFVQRTFIAGKTSFPAFRPSQPSGLGPGPIPHGFRPPTVPVLGRTKMAQIPSNFMIFGYCLKSSREAISYSFSCLKKKGEQKGSNAVIEE